MENFKREEHEINGVKAVVYVAGEGEPLLFFHGAGTFHGFEFAQPWVKQFKVILPYHPGYGESGDDPAMNSMDDYVLHYLDLLDVMGIDKVNLVGFSLGGYMAAKFASSHPERVRKLVGSSAPEVMIRVGGELQLIRRRQTLEQMIENEI